MSDNGGNAPDPHGAITGLYYLAGSVALITGPVVVGGLVDLLEGNYRIMFVFSSVFMAFSWRLLSDYKEQP